MVKLTRLTLLTTSSTPCFAPILIAIPKKLNPKDARAINNTPANTEPL